MKKMKKLLSLLLVFALAMSLCACSEAEDVLVPIENIKDVITENVNLDEINGENIQDTIDKIGEFIEDVEKAQDTLENMPEITPDSEMSWEEWFEWVDSAVGDFLENPEYNGQPYYVVNDNMPFFTDEDKVTDAFETYSELDSLGRCGVAYANICKKLMPTEERGDISSVYPSGWKYNGKSNNNEYDTALVNGGRIYNRCHLIGFQLAGENDNKLNLITGTRYMNVDGMLPFENMIDDYVEATNNHVLYRVTPVYEADELVCRGVMMEAWSVEDDGEGICFNIFCYNVQPGIEIDYATGENWLADESPVYEANDDYHSDAEMTYVLNTNSKKFHYEHCDSASQMSEKNKQVVTATRDELVNQGYTACGACKP